MRLTTETLKEHLLAKYDISSDELDDDTELLTSGLLDSFDVVDLVTFIESAAGVQIAAAEISLANFETISRILACVESKSTV